MSKFSRKETVFLKRNKKINFEFNGKKYSGFCGDTLASALLANNVILIGRSFKYHRPRGIISSGSHEPNALLEIIHKDFTEPNIKATTVELYNGLKARSQNCWPSVKLDFMSINDKFSNFIGAGFYYKTFMWPSSFWEKIYEPLIRKAAGLGKLSQSKKNRVSEKGFMHTDILIIGSGPSGLISAYIAGLSGVRVLLVEEDFVYGGSLNSDSFDISNMSSQAWVMSVLEELQKLPNVRIMKRTCVFGMFDHGIFGAIEKLKDSKIEQIFWKIISKKSFLCSGSLERLIPFQNNDLPGIMLSGSIRSYINRWGIKSFSDVLLFTNNDDAYSTAIDLIENGINCVGVVDTRENPRTFDPKIKVYKNSQVINARGKLYLEGIDIINKDGNKKYIKCKYLGVSGGWNPNMQISSHTGVKPVWDEKILTFIPGKNNISSHLKAIGSANGIFTFNECILDAEKNVLEVLNDLKFKPQKYKLPSTQQQTSDISPFWYVKHGDKRKWVDLQNDVTVKDIEMAYLENFRSVEHLKRYTTLGMGTDQGKTSNITGLAILASLSKKSIPEVGTTVFRPPYVPIPIDSLAGPTTGKNFKPIRLSPTHNWAKENGASFVESGLWLRAEWYAKQHETKWRETVDREVLSVRKSVGFCDVSTLGKIDIQGKDAQKFINKIYCNAFAKLPVGKVRYGLMLREDGLVMDDGTSARMSENHFIMTTTTANADSVYRHLEFCHQCLWPEMEVHLISTTDAWAQIAIAGPNSRKVLSKIIDPEFDISNESFPFMACKEISIFGGIIARLFRISFSGELAYELSFPTQYVLSFVDHLMEIGKEENIIPYGTEALGVMRIEKGHVAGTELNGTTTALNLNMGRMVSDNKDSVGSVLSKREGLNKDYVLRLVGILPINPNDKLISGSHLFELNSGIKPQNDLGYITSSCFSPSLDSYIALGFLKNGHKRHGDIIRVINPILKQEFLARICSPVFVDPNGDRLRA